MNWLFDNPLANLPGTYFLLLYAVVIGTALVVFNSLKSQFDQTAKMPLPPIPSEPDPFEIAYLRGGANELARSLVFALTQKSLLQIRNKEKEVWIEQAAKIDSRSLKPIERVAYDWFSTPRQPKELFRGSSLTESLQPFATTYEARLSSQQLITSGEMQWQLRKWGIGFAVFIAGLGFYKFLAALLKGYLNIGFLLLFAIVGAIALSGMSKLPRLTTLGKTYLERLQLAFEKLKAAPQIQTVQTAQPAYAGASVNGVDPLLLMVGVFGTTALAGTAYDNYNQAFYKSQQASSGGGSACGSSCGTSSDSCSGSSGDGGSSCSGGCGGCGGGCS